MTLAQQGTPYEGMVRDHEARHRAYCARWGMEYCAVFTAEMDQWHKLELARGAMETMTIGEDSKAVPVYSHVFIIDADAVVVDFESDLRECLPSWAWLGLVTHPFPMLMDVWHWNVGCSFWRNTTKAQEFISEVLKARERPGWHEQAEINLQIMSDPERWQSGFAQLSRHWNNNWHDQPNDQAVILGWHGYLPAGPRRSLMCKVASQYPWEAK